MTSRITAVLGPTNTGKTTYAIERMLAYRSGVIGLPLRLLAREVYDRIVAIRGPGVVALVTGEERIVPPRVAYWVCTVEAMPPASGAEFLAVDEIQLCADPERGHVFTDRLLHARGAKETLLLGSETMRGAIANLVPDVEFMRRERLSNLTYTGSKKTSRMRPRSAIVGFSVENVYAIAELLKRQKGGAAVVMGALSPRTRNAQVEMYQSGEVDYLVATDAIGMGLNLDIEHVAFSAIEKFDGRRMRHLMPNELAQIAGRAGRGMQNGTFGVTGDVARLDPAVVEAITTHSFRPLKKLYWRSSDLRFGTADALIASLEARTDNDWLTRVRESDDLAALRALASEADVQTRARGGPAVRLLWDVCRIPDFRGISRGEHASLLTKIYNDLHETGRIPDDWLARQIKRIDVTQGDIDALSKRLAYIRTWTYVAQRKGWVDDESHWRGVTRAVEDRLSDALHGALTQRFVDRRTAVLLRRLKQKERLVAEVDKDGGVTVEGETIGRLEGFRFIVGDSAGPEEAKTLKQAASQALGPEFHLRADRFYNAPDGDITLTGSGTLVWGDAVVGRLSSGSDSLKPQVTPVVDDEAGADATAKIQRRLQHYIDRRIATLFEPLLAMQKDETLSGLSKGFAFRMIEALGVLPRAEVANEVKELDQDARGALRKHGLRFGQFTIFLPQLLKPAPTQLRLVLWGLSRGLDTMPPAPPPGMVTVPVLGDAPEGYYTMAGYRVSGERAIRIDMLERLADLLRDSDSRNGFEATADMLSISGTTLEQFADLMGGLGYKAERGERAKIKAVADEPETPEKTAPDTPQETPVEKPDETPANSPEEQPAETPDAPPADPPAEVPVETPGNEPTEVPDPDLPTGVPDDTPAETPVEEPVSPPEPPTEVPGDAPIDPGTGPGPGIVMEAATAPAAPEMETFYTFTWGGRAAQKPRGQGKPGGKGKPRGERKSGGGKGKPGPKAKSFEARPPKQEKKIDPDNPFAAALAGLARK